MPRSGISIHTPHAGRDRVAERESNPNIYFNPHAPCGARLATVLTKSPRTEFQSTRPMRGATLHLPQFSDTQIFQSTRPMRGATLEQLLPPSWQKFQSTRPMRGATRVIERGKFVGAISIHTPHAGRDGVLGARADKSPDFNPHAPCGARPTQQYYGQYELGFQSTRPMRGATLPRSRGKGQILFQSTRPMRGATAAQGRYSYQSTYFNPHAPCGARHYPKSIRLHPQKISIHTPHAGRDPNRRSGRCWRSTFQSTRPMRGATGVQARTTA